MKDYYILRLGSTNNLYTEDGKKVYPLFTLGTSVSMKIDLRDSSNAPVRPSEFGAAEFYFALDEMTENSDCPALLRYNCVSICSENEKESIEINIPNLSSSELIEYLSSKERSEVYAEIGGVDADGNTVFVFKFVVFILSRVFIGSGESIKNDPAYLTAAEILAIIPALELEEGNDGVTIRSTDKNGSRTAFISNGKDGKDGKDAEPDYTSFDVYPNSVAIAKNTTFANLPDALKAGVPEHLHDLTIHTAIPIEKTHKFSVRSCTPRELCDVTVDWGDGTTEKLSEIADANYKVPDVSKKETEYAYTLMHTYDVADRKYKVKIHGRTYFAIEQNSAYSQNILCNCLDADNPLASHVLNISSFAKYALRLLYVQMGDNHNANKLFNISNCFLSSRNIYSISGFEACSGTIFACSNFCGLCNNLKYSDFRLPHIIVTPTSIKQTYASCTNLQQSITDLLPRQPFIGKDIDVNNIFNFCGKLTGTVPASHFWQNPLATFTNITNAFSSSALTAQVPTAWGGTASDDVIAGIAGFSKVVNTTATAPTLAVKANTVYVYQKALTRLTISTVDVSVLETTIYFTAGSSITVTLPASVKTIGSMSFEPNKSYVISIKDGVAVSAEVN